MEPGAPVVVCDGLPGAGKTTVARALAEKWRAPLIDEVVDRRGVRLPDFGRRLLSPADTLARMSTVLESDLTKHRLAQELARGGAPLVLVDRNHVYTLAVAHCLAEAFGGDVHREADAWYRRHRARLAPPSAYLLFDIDPDMSNDRIGWREEEANPLTRIEYRLKALEYMSAFRRREEPEVPVYRVDARQPLARVAEAAERVLSDLVRRPAPALVAGQCG